MQTPPFILELWTGNVFFSFEIAHNALLDARVLADSYRLQ